METLIVVIVVFGLGAIALAFAWIRTASKLSSERQGHEEFATRFNAITDIETEAENLRSKIRGETDVHAKAVEEHQQRRLKLTNQYESAVAKYQALRGELSLVEERLEDVTFGLYEPHFSFDSSEEYKDAIRECKDRQRALVRGGDAVNTPGDWTVGGSRTEGRKMERQYNKVMLRAFNGECDAAVAKVSWNNANRMVQRVEKAFADINKLGEVMRMSISKQYLKEKVAEIRLTHEHQDKKYQEREAEKEQRAQLREQERAEREIAKALEQAEREEERHQAALEKARAEADAATGAQLAKLTKQIASLETKVGEAHNQKQRAQARAELTRSGFVYVLSNQGSFGEGIVKIGMTRRMEPMDRVRELSGAAVPFPFDVHVMMFSDDAPGLEKSLHEHFGERRVNLVNNQKEYFRGVSLEEVETFIRERGVTAQFTVIAEAREYRETRAALAAQEEAQADEGESIPDSASLFDE